MNIDDVLAELTKLSRRRGLNRVRFHITRWGAIRTVETWATIKRYFGLPPICALDYYQSLAPEGLAPIDSHAWEVCDRVGMSRAERLEFHGACNGPRHSGLYSNTEALLRQRVLEACNIKTPRTNPCGLPESLTTYYKPYDHWIEKVWAAGGQWPLIRARSAPGDAAVQAAVIGRVNNKREFAAIYTDFAEAGWQPQISLTMPVTSRRKYHRLEILVPLFKHKGDSAGTRMLPIAHMCKEKAMLGKILGHLIGTAVTPTFTADELIARAQAAERRAARARRRAELQEAAALRLIAEQEAARHPPGPIEVIDPLRRLEFVDGE